MNRNLNLKPTKTDVAVYVPARNKADKITPCINSVLSQTYPCKFVFSDQYSEDGTYEVLEKILGAYHGPADVILTRCPVTENRGMAGLNDHMNWMHDQFPCDLVVITSSDDIMTPIRVEKTVEAYEKHKPSVILTKQAFHYQDDTYKFTACDKDEGFLTTLDMFPGMVGSSSSSSWNWKFYQDIGGCHGVIGCDVYVPYLGSLANGVYWLPTPLHIYECFADDDNMGLEGRRRNAVNDEVKLLQLDELAHYQLCSMYMAVYKKSCEFPGWDEEAQIALNTEIKNQFQALIKTRDEMSIRRIQPMML